MATDQKYNDKTTKTLGPMHKIKQPGAGPSGPTNIDGLPGNRTGTAAKAAAAGRKAAGRAK